MGEGTVYIVFEWVFFWYESRQSINLKLRPYWEALSARWAQTVMANIVVVKCTDKYVCTVHSFKTELKKKFKRKKEEKRTQRIRFASLNLLDFRIWVVNKTVNGWCSQSFSISLAIQPTSIEIICDHSTLESDAFYAIEYGMNV